MVQPPQRLLILNRRDFANPLGGGAEIYLKEVALGFQQHGWRVDWFASLFPGAAPTEQLEGVHLMRKGSELTCHGWARLALRRWKKEYDLVIDAFNGLGFGAAKLPQARLVVFQLYGNEFWSTETGLAAPLLTWVERALLRAYRKTPTVTISASTQGDLTRIGFERVTVVPVGLTHPPTAPAPARDAAAPHFVYAGRLRKTKNVEEALQAFLLIRKEKPSATLHVLGRGPQENDLRARYAGQGIEFLGYVSEAQKFESMRRAHLMLIPSLREGWNMVVTEAAAVGTPCIGYRVPGMQDSVRDGETGVLVAPHDIQAMSRKALRLLEDTERYHSMCESCLLWARSFTWERTRQSFYHEATK